MHLLPVAADPFRAPLALCRSAQDVAAECKYALENFPGLKEIFFDDDTFNYRKARTLEVTAELKKLNFTWSCTSRVTTDYETLKAMKEAGCRLLIVGYESRATSRFSRNIKERRQAIDMARRFTANCHKLGLHRSPAISSSVYRSETRQKFSATPSTSPRNSTLRPFRSPSAHAFPGTEFYDYAKKNNLVSIKMSDEEGHQLPNVIYPGILDKGELVEWVERFYGELLFPSQSRLAHRAQISVR